MVITGIGEDTMAIGEDITVDIMAVIIDPES